MVAFLTRLMLVLRAGFKPWASLEAWNLVLRQQLMVLNRRSARVRLRNLDRLVLVWLYRLFLPLLDAIIIVGEASEILSSSFIRSTWRSASSQEKPCALAMT
jgi:hypothetical protein